MIQNEDDKFYPVLDGYEKVTGYRPNPSTGCRYCNGGADGVVLESELILGKRMVTLSAVRRFNAARKAAHTKPKPQVNKQRSDAKREKDVARARKQREKICNE